MLSLPVRRWRWTVLPLVCALVWLLVPASSARAASFVPLLGDGSSWAGPAIDQWSRDVHGQGIVINFSGDGSAAGRQHYIVNQADFAASDIAFLTTPDPFGSGTEASGLAYSYVPIVAGGTAFMYNLVVGGKKITNLRLSGDTLAKIFTGQITNWNDPRVARDYGTKLPSQKITVVTRSDGSGASYQFTRWLSTQYHSQWTDFCHGHGGADPCGPTEFYPQFSGSVQRGGSDQVANYLASPSFGEGAIGYDEYAYARNSRIPVVKVLNSAGYYTLPTASNVAIALQAAVIDENPNSLTFLMQNLDNVYTNPDPRTYPLSSYSYLIVPRTSRGQYGPPPRFDDNKGATLSTWMNYVLCGAQQKAGDLGYSPLPKNLVVGGFEQVDNIPGHVKTPDTKQLNGCNNPTYSNGVNHLIKDAPQPSPCDKATAPLACVVVGGKPQALPGGPGTGTDTGTGPGSATGSTGTSGGNGSGGSGGVGGTSTGGARGVTGAGGGPVGKVTGGKTTSKSNAGGTVDPDTGAVGGGGQGETPQDLSATPIALTSGLGRSWVYASLTAVEILAALAAPSAIGFWLRRRRRAQV